MDERRQFRRKPVNARVRIFHRTGGEFNARTQNISDGGVLVIFDEQNTEFAVGDEIKMILLDSGKSDLVFNMQVVRFADGDMALQFLNYEQGGDIRSIDELRKQWHEETG